MAAKAAGDLPESVAPVPSTISLSSTPSTRPGSPSSTVDPTNQGDNGMKRPSNTGAIAGGVIGGLTALEVICVRIWIFFRRRAVGRGGQGYSEDIGVATGAAPMPEHGISPLQSLQAYVRGFFLLAYCPACVLTDIIRTRLTHPHTPLTLTTAQANHIRPPARVTTLVPPNYKSCL